MLVSCEDMYVPTQYHYLKIETPEVSLLCIQWPSSRNNILNRSNLYECLCLHLMMSFPHAQSNTLKIETQVGYSPLEMRVWTICVERDGNIVQMEMEK